MLQGTDLADALAALAATAGLPHGEPAVLADRHDGTLVRVGGTVVKAHAAGTAAADLGRRLSLAADEALAGVLLPPLPPARAGTLADGRYATLWPYGTPVDPGTPDAAPWEAAGGLLARLHSVPLALLAERHGPLPAMRGPAKAAAAVARMRAAVPRPRTVAAPARGSVRPSARQAVERAWERLPGWCRGEEPPPANRAAALCHGDFHLGQLVRHPASGGSWCLIDIDDLGHGDPAWDLARPAAWYAAGLLPPAAWQRLLGAYQAVPGTGGTDLWPLLDHPARALTVQSAALCVAKATGAGRVLDEDEEALVDACLRIARLTGGAAP